MLPSAAAPRADAVTRGRMAMVGATVLGLLGASITWSTGELPADGAVVFGTFLATGTTWVTGALPAHVAGLLAATMLAVTLSTGILTMDRAPALPWGAFLGQALSPAIAMTLAGMMLAQGAARTGVDRLVAARLLGPLLGRPAALLAMVLAIGAVLSMFMSNTATAVLLLAIVLPVVRPLGPGSPTARAIVLAAALGAAIGGLATPIGTTPNVIAYGLMRDAGHGIGVVQWVKLGLPVTAIALAAAMILLRSLAGGFTGWSVPAARTEVPSPGLAGWAWLAVFLGTVVLWSTEPWSGIPIMHSALLPILALPVLGLVRLAEFRGIDWRTLVLLFTGLVLGTAMGATGVAGWLVAWSVPANAPAVAVMGAFCAVSVVLSTFMSNTATANLLVPMALALGDPALAAPCALATAFGSSLAVGLPVSTPPVLLAHATGFVKPGELAMIGVVVGVVGSIAVTAAMALGH